MDITAFLIRIVSLVFAVGCMAYLSPSLALLAIIFLGQAHFLLAYWYKFAAIKPLYSSHFFRLWLVVSILLVLLGILNVFSPTFWIVCAGALFVLHNSIDDANLLQGYTDWFMVLVTLNGVLLLFCLELASLATGFIFSDSTLQVAAAVSGGLALAGTYMQRHLGFLFVLYALLVALLSMILLLVVDVVPVMLVLGCIILFHYMLWYLEYARKLWSHGKMFTQYIKRVVGLNIGLGAIALLAWWGIPVPLYEYFFSETFFFIWTTIHIIFSFVPKDLKLFQ